MQTLDDEFLQIPPQDGGGTRVQEFCDKQNSKIKNVQDVHS